ncbi:hypothetical protein N656DRAFT_780949 [Canariomyces notabilis]|uniref:Peroxisomal membrane protein PEX14 n=1 Tax=Canariomyces notabilis TaxID=2074819 RepID=A0AAN6TB73_9PEZI|nr:hypothetical protein N656DRAFT_780949 [Canariomyces arenarius]
MGDEECKTQAQATPAQAAQTAPPEARLEQARKFLRDAQVQNEIPERKAQFLRSKGFSDSDIEGLLKEVLQDSGQESQVSAKEETIEVPTTKKEDRPPIVTYPEFLTKPARPPPLVTVNGFLNTLYAFAGLATAVYGTSRYIAQPMADSLTEARVSLHETAKQDLAKLVSKLESTVSDIPTPKLKDTKPPAAEDNDAASSYDDPTELFHRDIGVQTSRPPSPFNSTAIPTATSFFGLSSQSQSSNRQPQESPTALQTRQLSSLTASLKMLGDGLVSQTESLGEVQTVLDLLKEDLDTLSATQTTDFVGGYSLYGAASRNEPDDEIRQAKENIRRVKGVLLSTRSFPATTR